MDNNVLLIVVLCLAVILAVMAFNMYQEHQYRKKMREQFGHSDQDALLGSKTESVRDGKKHGKQNEPLKVRREHDLSQSEPVAAVPLRQEPPVPSETAAAAQMPQEQAAAAAGLFDTPNTAGDAAPAEAVLQTASEAAEAAFTFETVPAPVHSQTVKRGKQKLLLDLDDMAKQELPWFDPRFDYLAYVSLSEPQELHALPRLSGRHRFQIAGCTMDNRWQIAEPIPSVYYQGFIIGLQAVSRSGLASMQDLENFGAQANAFAEKLDAGLGLTDVAAFLDIARPLDEVCARVDQTIAIHLVSRTDVSGTELRASLERLGFELGHDGAFHLPNEQGEPLFSVVSIDNSAFTAGLLASQAYRGFSMLFDIPHVPAGEKTFNRFMDLAVRLSSELGLDLVNDKLEELSTEWLKDVRRYVLARQDEMQKIGVSPGGDLAKRLFS
ncbi:cell division protein ZipA C-terminal FtsZ-binding domain-containing protein [Neisseria leonii]|uniref:cell division protein ZipA C-terminal FtsZ-binding domain-containing protein n=1 Tax=Neisseria leonii TaxID=2995413 RepID=UPI0030D36A3A